jgi:transcriptional regulator with XRE-family HTH domain
MAKVKQEEMKNSKTLSSAVGAAIAEARLLSGYTVADFCQEAGISVKSYYRLMHKKRPNP